MSVKLLSVDDSKTIRLIIAKAFRPFDCVMMEASNGEEALAVAGKERPDLIILDLTMPVMDGYETLKRLRADPKLKDIPVVMLTAEAGRDNVMRIAQLGVQGYVIKPFVEAKIIERVGKVVPLKPKPEVIVAPTKCEDPVGLLVVDDKPAIIDNIKSGLAQTPWKVSSAVNSAEAIEVCGNRQIDVVIISLSLPQEAAIGLFRTLRSQPRTKETPILGMAMKTATAEQMRAQQVGFNGMITKPISVGELRTQVCRALSLDTSGQYFEHRDGSFVVTVPNDIAPKEMNFVMSSLTGKISDAVDAGLAQMIVDLGAVHTAEFSHVKLLMEVIGLSEKMGLKCKLIGSPEVVAKCSNFEDSKMLVFAGSYDEAVAQVATG